MAVGRLELVEMMAQQHAAREVGAGHAVARIAEGKEMMREVPVGPDVGQSIGGARVGRVPSVLGKDSRNVGIERGQLVHQLAGPLHGEPVALARRRRQHVGSGDQQPLIVDPPDEMPRARPDRARPPRGVQAAGGSSPGPVPSSPDRWCETRNAGRSDLKSGVGRPVAMTTRSARIDPAAVMTSAFRRPNLIFRTADRSKIVAPRSAAAAARPRQARYGSSTPPAVSRMAAAASRPSSFFTTRAPSKRRVDAGVAPRFVIALQPDGLIGRSRDDRGPLRAEPALDVEAPKQRGKIERRSVATT